MRMLTPFDVWAPRSLISQFWDDLDPFFASLDSELPTIRSSAGQFSPTMNVQETEDQYLLSLEVPGVKKEDLRIELNGNVLTVSGERHQRARSEQESVMSFQRSLTLPDSVDVEKIEANCENGVLQIALPKLASAKPRRIEIGTKRGGLLGRFLGEPEKEARKQKTEIENSRAKSQDAKVS